MDQNRKQAIIKKIIELKLTVESCSKCDGTGLQGYIKWTNEVGVTEHAWNGEYCQKCSGLGFFLPDENFVLFFCPSCYDGTTWRTFSCSTCGGIGVVDWIQNLTRNHSNDWNLQRRIY